MIINYVEPHFSVADVTQQHFLCLYHQTVHQWRKPRSHCSLQRFLNISVHLVRSNISSDKVSHESWISGVMYFTSSSSIPWSSSAHRDAHMSGRFNMWAGWVPETGLQVFVGGKLTLTCGVLLLTRSSILMFHTTSTRPQSQSETPAVIDYITFPGIPLLPHYGGFMHGRHGNCWIISVWREKPDKVSAME